MRFQYTLSCVFAALALVRAAPLSHSEIEAKASAGLRLLSLKEGAEPVWKTEDEKLDLLRARVQFVIFSN